MRVLVLRHGQAVDSFEALTDEQRWLTPTGRARVARMAVVDDMSPAMRELVNEYGFAVVRTLLDVGVTKPRHVRHVVETILDEFSPTRGSYSKQGVRTEHAS